MSNQNDSGTAKPAMSCLSRAFNPIACCFPGSSRSDNASRIGTPKALNPLRGDDEKRTEKQLSYTGDEKSRAAPGSDESESQLIPDPNVPAEQNPAEERIVCNITFWRNGFNMGDGPLMDYNDPQSVKILQAIDRGIAPAELMKVRNGQPVELRVESRMGEDYISQSLAAS